jgi:hypothetical protein
MKILSFTYCILITAVLLFGGCKKDSDKEPPVPVCRVQTITQSSVVLSFLYDSSKRVSRVAYSDGTLEEYSYKGDTIRILKTQNGAFEQRKIITNNAQGMATQVRLEENQAGTSGLVINYQYTGTELIQEIQKPIGSASTTVTIYTWSAGNLTEISSGGTVSILDYYTNKPSQAGNYLEVVNVSQGYTNIKTKNLLKSVTQSDVTVTINYTFDKDGNITQAEFIGGSSNNAIGLTYQCE